MLQKIREKFLKKMGKRDQRGATLLELIIPMSLLAFTSSFVVIILGQTAQTNVLNQNISAAGTQLQNVVDMAQISRNCFELEEALSGGEFNEDTGGGFVVTSEITAPNEGCKPGEVMTYESIASQNSDGRVLYRVSGKVFISR